MMSNLFYTLIKITIALLIFICPVYGTQLVSETLEDQQYTDSFDSVWAWNINVSVSSTYARTGTYSLKMSDPGDGWPSVSYTLPGTPSEGTEYYISYYQLFAPGWDWSLISETHLKQFRARGSDGEPVITFNRSQWPSINFFWSFEGTAETGQTTVFTAPSTATWYRVEIYIKYSATVGVLKIWFGGVEVENTIGIDTLTWNTTVTAFELFGGNGAGQVSDWYIDDIEIWNELPSGETARTAAGVTAAGCSFH